MKQSALPSPVKKSHPVRTAGLILVLLITLLGFMRLSAEAPAEAANAPIPVYHITTAEFASKVLQSPIPVVVQFDADWCPYCRKVQPLLSQFAADRQGKVAVYKVNIDHEKGLGQLFAIQSLPTMLLIKGGMEAGRLEGVPNKLRFYAWAAQ